MARRRLIVHLGLFKTGTTSIQQYLADHAYALHAAGIHYPLAGRHPVASTQHAVLADAFSPTKLPPGVFGLHAQVDRDLVVKALRHEIDLAGKDTVVLSSEVLGWVDGDGVRAFGAAFADFQIQPVCFLRNLADLFSSWYGTYIAYDMGDGDPELSLVGGDLVPPLREWAAISHDGAVDLVDYDASPTGNSVRDFLQVTGLGSGRGLPPCDRAPRLNPSSAPAVIALIREMRRYGIEEEHIHGLAGQLGGLRPTEPQSNLPPALYAALQTSYATLHAELRQAPYVRWSGASEPLLHPEPPVYVGDLTAAVFALGRSLQQWCRPPAGEPSAG